MRASTKRSGVTRGGSAGARVTASKDGGRSCRGPGERRRRGGWTRPVFVAKDDLEKDVMGDELTEKSRAMTQSVTPLGSYETDLEDVLQCNNLWGVLKPMPSPLKEDNSSMGFVSNRDRVAISSLFHGSSDSIGANCGGASIYDAQEEICVPISAWAYRAGARKEVWFNPKTVRAAIVTCGGLCPGLNDVVRGIVQTLYQYGVKEGNILGIKFGFRGFYSYENQPISLTMREVDGIQRKGGTLLGTSRGGADMDKICDSIQERGVNMVFVIGGNGGNAGASALSSKCTERDYPCAVIGVPKSIDNDILVIDKTFGFDTACQEGVKAINAAYVEASSAFRGVGLVKLMGRQSGFIALNSSLASGEVDVCLIPETKFDLHGERGLLKHIERTLEAKSHCVVVVAEGAYQDEISNISEKDASGNPILTCVGTHLREEIKKYFSGGERKKVDLKYIDPTYMIRAVETNTSDKIYCYVLAQGAVHAAFAGFTGITVGMVNTHTAYFPIDLIVSSARRVDTRGKTWQRLLSATMQPSLRND
ncbi:ATP-dependent 6-phosphofructokinase [Chloropicon primus]|uniref:ATP-dependent 6-phosphofructokinase n=2 Tax=Chloropicon primus TaxID=1764295 RepID=A0A5B8MMK5_9CHLO|nr:ATP-dependent 6-phosphofructokinase [Chloropicon primus]|eukprot:QDZ21274.1 ATP-dependent 6-phosphofructokinase [Chloropicon primus]